MGWVCVKAVLLSSRFTSRCEDRLSRATAVWISSKSNTNNSHEISDVCFQILTVRTDSVVSSPGQFIKARHRSSQEAVFVTLPLMVWILITTSCCLDRAPDWTSTAVSLIFKLKLQVTNIKHVFMRTFGPKVKSYSLTVFEFWAVFSECEQ